LGTLRRWKQRRPGRLVGVGGCLAQQDGERLRARAPHVDIVFGTHNIANLPDMVRKAERRLPTLALGMGRGITHWDVVPHLANGAVSAMVSIMQGCDNFCAYCVVPLVRGREESRPAVDIVSEVRSLAARGVIEVVLLGQNVNSYGKKEGEIPFPELLRRISRVEGISRIRFITSHPRDLDDRTIRLFAEIDTLCPHVHLPLQSGSDRILASMGRGYTRGEYLAKIEALRRVRPTPRSRSDSLPDPEPGRHRCRRRSPRKTRPRGCGACRIFRRYIPGNASPRRSDKRSPFSSKERARGIRGCVAVGPPATRQ
ncbi:MAG: tRNA-i(6)A37 thiotransferase enzyme MiaB, partial [Deltaproteobacteria bacterium]|nr:tRNA-i(6)A37 thiotransferase enzyme MiaB [Deltaproteobacteria bacterium]